MNFSEHFTTRIVANIYQFSAFQIPLLVLVTLKKKNPFLAVLHGGGVENCDLDKPILLSFDAINQKYILFSKD